MRAVLLAVLTISAPVLAAPKVKKAPRTLPPRNATLPAPEAADAPDSPDAIAISPSGQQHGEGEYGGVKPGVKPEKPRKLPSKGTLSWIGFEAKSGNAEIFLQSVAPFDVQQRVDNGALVVDLALDKLGQNTWREVDARFFDTPIARITAKRTNRARKAVIEVRISFKNAKDAHEGALRSASEADGMYYQYLSFGGGSK